MTLSIRSMVASVFAVALVLGVVACGGGEPEPAPEPDTESEPQATGSFEITVNLDGEAPEQEMIDLSGNPECGMDERRDQQVVQNENGSLRYSVVAVKEAPSGLPNRSAETPRIDQENCMYTPRVVTAQAGQTIEIVDSDPQMHNVRATRDSESVFNVSTFEGDVEETSFEDPGVYSLVCDVHPWMQGWVYVTSHGQAGVTGENGVVSLGDLPTGDYVLEVWHEQYGTQEVELTVEEDSTTTESVTFSS